MNREELQARMREELLLPFYVAKIADKDYSEEELQELKKNLAEEQADYMRDYVDYADNDMRNFLGQMAKGEHGK